MPITLTDRYVDAVVRTVPEKQRDDVATELRASISDQIDARLDAGEQADAAERAVLTELGDPDALAAGFADRPLFLVGPKYYLSWWRLLKLLLWIVIPCVAFAVALGQAIAGQPVGTIIGSTWGVTLTAAVHLAFWTTLVFVIIERSEAATGKPTDLGSWTLDDLPEPREKGATLADAVATWVLLALGAVAVLWDHFLGFVPGRDLPVLDPGLWPWWIAGLFAVMAVEASLHFVVYRRGRWTWGLAAMNAVLDVLIAVPAVWLLVDGRLINPELWSLVPANAPEVPGILTLIVGFSIVGIAIWDAIDAFWKARR